jgi:TonB family protein
MTFPRPLAAATVGIGLVAWVNVSAQAPAGPPRLLQVVGAFVQSEPGSLEQQANPITPENPIPRRSLYFEPRYPLEASRLDARGTVSLRITLDDLGRVAEVRTTGVPVLGAVTAGSGDEAAALAAIGALVESARHSVWLWLYDAPANPPIAFDVAISFGPAKPEIVFHGSAERRIGLEGGQLGGGQSPRAATPPLPPLPPELSPAGPDPDWMQGVTRVGGNFTPPRKTVHVSPIYPDEALRARVQGVVIVEARIEADGTILHARILRSIPMLDQAALDAVRQWEFTPTLQDGRPVPVMMTMTVQFSLQ